MGVFNKQLEIPASKCHVIWQILLTEWVLHYNNK